jgi:hypothetical protein
VLFEPFPLFAAEAIDDAFDVEEPPEPPCAVFVFVFEEFPEFFNVEFPLFVNDDVPPVAIDCEFPPVAVTRFFKVFEADESLAEFAFAFDEEVLDD